MSRPIPSGYLVACAAAGLLLVSVASRAMADATRVFPAGEVPPDRRRERAVTLDGDHPWKPPAGLEAWQAQAARLRRQILVAAGLWPLPSAAPFEATVHSPIEREGYTVEKVFFQSFPGFWVTGNLYRPRGGPGRKPAVLCPHGHWSEGRFHERSEDEARKEIEDGAESHLAAARYPLQARCVHLARMGCVVFHYDMVGYADSRQIAHRTAFTDLEAELRLQSVFGLQTWNTLRAYDFLASLPDVDPGRIGVTGASGGGTQTFILCGLDRRPRAAFPAVMVSTEMQGGCVCENASHLRVGATNIAFAALAAPRPYGMTGADDWTRRILEKGLPELRAVWALHGAEDRVAAWCHPEFGHNYNGVSRGHMYRWFRKHLDLGGAPVEERPFEPVAPAALSVFDEEHPRPGGAVDAEGLRAGWAAASDARMRSLEPRNPETLAEFRRVVGGALEVLLHTRSPPADAIAARERDAGEVAGHRLRRWVLARRGTGEAVPVLWLEPQGDPNGVALVVVSGRGKRRALFDRGSASPPALRGPVAAALERGAAVLSPDVFLTGEHLGGAGAGGDGAGRRAPVGPASDRFPKDTERHDTYVGYTYGYNRTLLAERVYDVLTACAFAGSRPGIRSVRLVAVREAGTWAVLAGALARKSVDRVFAQIESDTPLDVARLDDPAFLPGAVKYGGLAAFAALRAPHELRIAKPGGPWRTAVSAYRAAGRPDRLQWDDPEGMPNSGEDRRELLDRMARP